MRPFKGDFTLLDASGRPVAVVEAKAARWDPESAQEFRQAALERSPELRAQVFLLVTPRAIYAWAAGAAPHEVPQLESVTDPFAAYFRRANVDPDGWIAPTAFEHLVSWWLSDLVRGEGVEPDPVARLGLKDLVRGGSVALETAA